MAHDPKILTRFQIEQQKKRDEETKWQEEEAIKKEEDAKNS